MRVKQSSRQIKTKMEVDSQVTSEKRNSITYLWLLLTKAKVHILEDSFVSKQTDNGTTNYQTSLESFKVNVPKWVGDVKCLDEV